MGLSLVSLGIVFRVFKSLNCLNLTSIFVRTSAVLLLRRRKASDPMRRNLSIAKTLVAGVSALALLVGVVAPAAQAAPSPAVAAKSTAVTVKEGVPSTITGRVPAAYANSLVVLEAVKGRHRQELGQTVSGRGGEVKLSVTVGGVDASYTAQWRVIKNRTARWTSKPFTIKVVSRPAGQSDASEQASSIAAAALAGGRAGTTSRALHNTQYLPVVKQVGSTAVGVGTSIASGKYTQAVGDGVSGIYKIFFPQKAAPALATASQVDQLSQQLALFNSQAAQGFAIVQGQLNGIQSGLTSLQGDIATLQNQIVNLQQQVTTLQNTTVQANATAAAGTCATLLSEANGYVDTIQNFASNYQNALDPEWIRVNALGLNAKAGLTAVGNEIFGAGSGVPSFSDGVGALQVATSNLVDILITNGAPGTPGLIPACASAIAANLAVQYAGASASTIIPAGAIDQAYFDSLQSIVGYYTSWAALAQGLATRGGQMGLAVLQSSTVRSLDELNAMCAGQSPQPGSVLTCGGMLYNNQRTMQVFEDAWDLAGASWSQVSGGMLAADTKAPGVNGFLTAPKHVWVKDIANYGAGLKVPTTSSVTGVESVTVTSPVTGAPLPTTTTSAPGFAFSGYFVQGTGANAMLTLNFAGNWCTPATQTGCAPGLQDHVTDAQVWKGAVDWKTLSTDPAKNPDPWQTFAMNGGGMAGSLTIPVPTTTQALTVLLPCQTTLYVVSIPVVPLFGSIQPCVASVVIVPESAPQGSTVRRYVPDGPISAVSMQQPTVIPAQWMPSANGGPGGTFGSYNTNFTFSNWLGMPFTAANTTTWRSLIPPLEFDGTWASGPSRGSRMAQAGLLDGGAAPADLVLYTGEQSTLDMFSRGAPGRLSWFDFQIADWCGSAIRAPHASGGFGIVPATNADSFVDKAYSFVDTNLGTNWYRSSNTDWQWRDSSIVVDAPATTAEDSQLLQQVMSSQDGANNLAACDGWSKGDVFLNREIAWTSRLVQSGGTQGAGFYAPFAYRFSYPINVADSYAVLQATPKYTVAGTSYLQNPNAPRPYGFGWPVLNLNSSGQPAGASNCKLTSFTQGAVGSTGIPQVCTNLFDDWLAGAVGIGSGPVSINGGGYQGTLTAANNNVIQYQLTNASSTMQPVHVLVQGSNGAQVGTTASAAAGDSSQISGISCTNATVGATSLNAASALNGALVCSMQVPPGTSMLNVPLNASGGTINAALAGSGSASSSVTQVAPVAANASELPEPVTDLAAVAGATSNSTVLQWTVPNAAPAISGYEFVITSPSGAVTLLSTNGDKPVTVANGTTAGATASATITSPGAAIGGLWKIGVAAVSPAGVSPMTFVTAALGASVPPAPTGFQADLTLEGAIALVWKPVTASPPLSNYSLAITVPGVGTAPSQTTTVKTQVPQYVIQDIPSVGTYSFSLTAVNSLGASTPVTATVNITGAVPKRPIGIDVSLDPQGWVGVTWLTSDGIPVVESYIVSLYEPGSTAASTPVSTTVVDAPNRAGTVRVPDFYRFKQGAQTGEWFVAVTPVNSVGIGEYGLAQLHLSTAAVARFTANQHVVSAVQSIPQVVLARAKMLCEARRWPIGLSGVATCKDGVLISAHAKPHDDVVMQ